MNNKIIAVLVISLIFFGTIGIVLNSNQKTNDTIDEEEKKSEGKSPVNLANITSYDEAVNAFSFDLYKKITENNSENMFISPYSIFTALAMTYEGARNDTAAELKEVLNVEQDNESFRNYMSNLYDYLNENSEYNISTANALWPRKGYYLLDKYKRIIQENYGGNSEEVDYSNPDKAAETINNWVENQTNNLIQNLISPSLINPLTMLILTNAIYFKAQWKIQFEKENTTKMDFTKLDNEVVSVDTMKLVDTEDTFNFTKTEKLKILELPYKSEEISMYIVLPEKGFNIYDIQNFLDDNELNNLVSDMNKKEIDIYLPKFKITKSYDLVVYLKELGMDKAFTVNVADFSGIDGTKNLYIGKVIHKAFIEINETGTEAAAATAIVCLTRGIDGGEQETREEFKCDHPFMFILMHKATNTILFMGNIMEPVIEE